MLLSARQGPLQPFLSFHPSSFLISLCSCSSLILLKARVLTATAARTEEAGAKEMETITYERMWVI